VTDDEQKMNPEIKAAWAAWLRENTGKQVIGSLRRIGLAEDGSDDKFCCLGGLCELAVQAGVLGRRREDSDLRYEYFDPENPSYDFSPSALPLAVQRWAGLKLQDPWVQLAGGTVTSLINVNDGIKLPFTAIAQIIEEQL
jgi:hypothetical protein